MNALAENKYDPQLDEETRQAVLAGLKQAHAGQLKDFNRVAERLEKNYSRLARENEKI